MAGDGSDDSGRRSELARRYPPVAFLAVALVLALAVLPSALTLPQSNPSQTVEIAPVPPDEEAPPQQGNTAELSLGEGDSTLGDGALGGGGPGQPALEPLPPPPPLPGEGSGKTRRTKRCVQTSMGLRQTADITSPPCAADFSGDNGGATYQGVTGDEIRILIYAEGGIISSPTPRGTDNSPTSTLVDLDAPPEVNEHGDITTMRVWFKYFNDRYQLYDRRAHGYIYFSSARGTQQARQADAAAAYQRVRPFAVVSTASYFGSADAFLTYMAQQGVLNFGSVQGRPQEFFQRFPKLIWGYPPSLGQQAKVFNDYVCSKVATSRVGMGRFSGQARKYGLIYTSDPAYPNLTALKDAVKQGLARCGVTFAEESAYPVNGFAVDPLTNDSYAQQGMARFSSAGVNTIIWAGGSEPNYTKWAQTTQYFPEWFVAGDGQNDAASYAVRQMGQQAWGNAWNVTPAIRFDSNETTVCYQEYRSQDPSTTPDADVVNSACPVYNDLRQLFTGIQVAGPRLGPASVDRGYHAIPAIESSDPRTPACFYEPGDYTCVKDAQVMWYDPNGQTVNDQQPGCWRMIAGGRRHIAGRFPAGAPIDEKNRSGPNRDQPDACNNYSVNYNINNS